VKDDLFAKLARLRREPGSARLQPGPGTAGLQPGSSSPSSSPHPSARLEPGGPGAALERGGPGGAIPEWLRARFEADDEAAPSSADRSIDPPADLTEHANERGTFAARLRTYASDHAHGEWELGEVLATPASVLAWLARDPALATLLPERAVYLDIETTGLSGGAGTIPFLVALGTFDGGQFHLWQAFLRDPSEEAAALAEIAERVRAASGVVSFFGKSFDRHRLEDKMRLHRIAPPFAAKPHLDLYHPLRRLYRGAYLDGRLATFESELCGVAREHDLPGSQAPAAWFDFLAERPHRLEAVFRHNELDVLSLVTLAAHLACARSEQRRDGRALPGASRARARALAELHTKHREHAAALAWLEQALTRPGGDSDEDNGELWFRHAECLRKLGQREPALAEFLRLARERDDALAARAWGEVARLARRLRQPELEAEARSSGVALVERTLTGSARKRALVSLRQA